MAENNLFDIKKRVIAAKQTRKITGTMELIASSRLHRARVLLANYRDWAKHMREAAQCLPDSYFEPLADSAGDGKKAYIVFGGSKGLSGSYGSNVMQYAAPITNNHLVIAVGSATKDLFPNAHKYYIFETPSADGARAIALTGKALYERKTVDEVYIVYMRGTAMLCERLFPLTRTEEYDSMLIVEPSKKALFPVLLEEYMETIVFEAQLHAFIAEQLSRVAAMDNATRNADEIIEGLQSTYNRIRQSAITQEIIMVSNAAKVGGNHGK